MMQQKKPIVLIIVPCKDEYVGIDRTKKILVDILNNLKQESEISNKSSLCFIDDGSTDHTWDKIKEWSSSFIFGIKLTRNFGHQNALMSGFSQFYDFADAFITIDADLQDDPIKIKDFILEYKKGIDIVYGVRENRKSDTFFKRNTALLFYKLQRFMGINTLENHADYRLMSKKAVDKLLLFDEPNIFLRGIVPMLGYKSSIVKYTRTERIDGDTKYPFLKMLGFALDGITSFSMKPLRAILLIGFIVFLFSMMGISWVLFQKYFGYTSQGWSSLMLSFYLSTGVQMISLGIIGEYVGKTFQQTKNRPNFIIEETLS